jgi:acylphosphatase
METSPHRVRVALRIEGRVQGVYFRASTVAQARKLGVTGWVMNCSDGSVEAVAEGRNNEIEELIAWCRQGPPGAHVTLVDVRYENARDEFRGFSIKR